MHSQVRRCLRAVLTLSLGGLLAACGSFNSASHRLASAITPYKVEVVQGNFVSREQVAALQPGMSREQVREILGTPLVTSVFHADRWEYVFTLKRPKVEVETRKLTVFFAGERFDHAEGDDMPSEAEFVARLAKPLGAVKVPVLEATEAQLARYPAAKPSTDEVTSATEAPAPQRSYPPLETTR